jgi:electron transport complex protein RnfG
VGIVDLAYKVVAIDVERIPGTEVLNPLIEEPEFENEFVGLSVEELYLSPEGKVDAVTGATISSDAVTDTVREKIEEIISK